MSHPQRLRLRYVVGVQGVHSLCQHTTTLGSYEVQHEQLGAIPFGTRYQSLHNQV